jgi:hypothetical protein
MMSPNLTIAIEARKKIVYNNINFHCSQFQESHRNKRFDRVKHKTIDGKCSGFRERRAFWGVLWVLCCLDRKVKSKKCWKRIFHLMVCVNSPGADPMHLRTLRIYRRCDGVDGPILRNKIHCHCNLSPWKTRTYSKNNCHSKRSPENIYNWILTNLPIRKFGKLESRNFIHNDRHSPQSQQYIE